MGIRVVSTSSSDQERYRNACRVAASEENAFSRFRQDPDYCQILEHFEPAWAERYLEAIYAQDPDLMNKFVEVRRNDDFGGPETTEVFNLGRIAPSTLRYLKFMSDLRLLFGSLEGLEIVEIGGGYGGLCRLILSIEGARKYTLFDLPEPLDLARAYLSKFGSEVVDRVEFKCLREDAEPVPSDLAISTAAFTECTPAIQELYIPLVLSVSKRGYLLCNEKPEAYPLEALFEMLPSRLQGPVDFAPETPRTAPANVIVTWGASASRRHAIGRIPRPRASRRLLYRAGPTAYVSVVRMYRAVRRRVHLVIESRTSSRIDEERA